MDIEIRFAEPADYDSCFEYDQLNKRAVLEEKIQKRLVLLAFYNQEHVGYLRWDWFWNRIPYLFLIKVKKSVRNKGIGSALLDFWEKHLKDKGFDYCLSSSQENEPPAVEWHLSKGFTEIGRLATLNEDESVEIFLRKDLSRSDL